MYDLYVSRNNLREGAKTGISTPQHSNFSTLSMDTINEFEKKTLITSANQTDEEKRLQRIKRFALDCGNDEEDKRELRRKRFGIQCKENTKSEQLVSNDAISESQKKEQRAKRFGSTLISSESQLAEKIQQRRERFNLQREASQNLTSAKEKEESWTSKILARQLRFGNFNAKVQ